jgi:hypothetical protein
MKPTTPINRPIPTFRPSAKIPNFGKAGIPLQNRRNELFARGATFVNATPLGITVQLAPTVTSLRFQLHAKPALGTDTIKRSCMTAPRLNFPCIGTIEATLTIWVALPATMFATNDSAATMRTMYVILIEALFAQILTTPANMAILSIKRTATTGTLEPLRLPTRTTVFFVAIVRVEANVTTATASQTATIVTTRKSPIMALNAPIHTIGAFAQVCTLAPVVKPEQTATIVTHGIKVR